MKELTVLQQQENLNKILQLENIMKAMPQTETPMEHVFAPGVYVRCMNIPKGCTAVGKVHKTKHINILAMGKLSISDKNGTRIAKAPCIFVSEPGIKKAAFAHEDSVMMNIHATDKTDLSDIENDVISKTLELE